jgi:hypothetical protein
MNHDLHSALSSPDIPCGTRRCELALIQLLEAFLQVSNVFFEATIHVETPKTGVWQQENTRHRRSTPGTYATLLL